MKKIIINVFFLFISSNIFAQTNSNLKLISLSDLIQIALKNNPDISAMKNRIEADNENITSVSWPEQPIIQLEYYIQKDKNLMFTFTQPLPYPWKISTEVKAAKKERKISQVELISRTISVISELKKAYFMHYFAVKKTGIILENIKIMQEIKNSLNASYITGKTPQSDILKMESEIAKMNNMILMFESDEKSGLSMIKALLNYSNEFKSAELLLPPEDSLIQGLTNFIKKDYNSPEIKIKQLSMEKNSYNLTLSKLNWIPDLMIGAKVDTMGDASFMLGFSIPLYFPKQIAEVKKMKYEYKMSRDELRDSQNMFQANIGSLLNRYQARITSVKNFKYNIIPLSEETLKLSQTGFITGKYEFLDLLDSQTRYLQNKIEYYDELAELKFILFDMEKLIGRQL